MNNLQFIFSTFLIIFLYISNVHSVKFNFKNIKQIQIRRDSLFPADFKQIEQNTDDNNDEEPEKIERIGLNVKKIETFPYHVRILSTGADARHGNVVACSGALISDEWVLTAAHCLENALDSRIYLGRTNVQIIAPGSLTFDVEYTSYIIHELYDSNTMDNDIALIHLPTRIADSDTIVPIALISEENSQENRFFGQPVVVSGWGPLTEHAPSVLEYATVYIIGQMLCHRYYGSFITRRQICQYGNRDEAIRVCEGDSGQPMVADIAGDSVLIGISSYISKEGCAAHDVPRVFTRVSEYLPWINENTEM